MDHVFYVDFDNLLREYAEPVTREDKLIKHKLDSIVALYDNCSVEEREFADEITLEFSRIIALLKNQHRQELMELSQQYQDFGNRSETLSTAYIPLHRQAGDDRYEYDYEVLNDFYDHFKRPGDDQLSYWQIEGYEFESEEDRRAKVNLTMLDYCNRIKTFAKKYLYEIYPEDSIPRIIHNEYDDDYETFEPIVFIYNNIELIIAKMKTTNEEGKTIKQRLNIRSALKKMNEFKQLADTDIESNPNNYVQKDNPFEQDGIFESNESIEETFRYYLQYHYKKKQFTGTQVSKIFNMLKFLWRRFYSDYENGKLPKELSDAIEKDDVVEDELVNVYTHIAELNAFLAMMQSQSPLDKAWKDLQVVLDVFAVFVNCAKSN